MCYSDSAGQTVDGIQMSSREILKRGNQFYSFGIWQQENPYAGKQFSILGDSISTLDGYNPRGYRIFYTGDNCERSGIFEMQDTWWGMVLDYFGGKLLRNNSWSGSRVSKLPSCDVLFPSGCSDERTSGLHINSIKPDVIIIYMGTNDWAVGALCGIPAAVDDSNFNCIVFDYAYDTMLRKLKESYPDSEIWCCTLCETYMVCNPSFQFPHSYGGNHI